ncbi:hypothetical protein VCV18_003370 [Metarhizium anisopliae]
MAEVSKWRRFKNSASRGGRGGGGGDDDDAKDSRSRSTLKHLVYNFWTFVASDPRDKVFAYYGLLNLYAAERHRADYGMGLAGICTAATRDLIRGEASLAALSSCVYPLHRRKHLPSWVPDYSVVAANPVPRSFARTGGWSSRRRALRHEAQREARVWPVVVKLPLPLRVKGGYLPGASLSCILWTTLCMDTSPGNKVYVLPAVLRLGGDSAGDGRVGRYSFIGAEYVSGLMHGEVVLLLRSDVGEIKPV